VVHQAEAEALGAAVAEVEALAGVEGAVAGNEFRKEE
jgi:hypothetical protein